MQRFSATSRVNAESALHDRVDIKLGEWFVRDLTEGSAAEDSLAAFLNFLATAPPGLRATREAGLHGLIFTRAGGPSLRSRILRVRSGSTVLRSLAGSIPPPLFAGKLTARIVSTVPPVTHRLTADLHLNPTCYVRHSIAQQRPRRVLQPCADIFENQREPDSGEERSLDGNDNWIPLQGGEEIPFTPHDLRTRERCYFTNVKRRIEHEMDAAIRACGIAGDERALQSVPLSSLRACETYWEFLHDEPLRLVESLERIGQRFAATTQTRLFPLEREQNSLLLRCQFRVGVSLHIYAKTNKRVRFEVRHDLPKCNAPFHRIPPANSAEEIEAGLAILRSDAAGIVNQFLRMAGDLARPGLAGLTPAALCLRVLAACNDLDHAEELLQILCTTGRVVIGNRNPLKPAVMKLKQRGILSNRSGTNIYSPTRQYRHAVEYLSEVGRLDLFFRAPTHRATA